MAGIVLDPWMWRKIIRTCISLRIGRFALRKGSMVSDDFHPSSLTNLVSLHVKFLPHLDVGLFSGLTFPVVQELHISGYMPMRINSTFVHWIQQCSIPLRRLTLDINILDPVLLEVLRCLPNLVNLKLYLNLCRSIETMQTILGAAHEGHLQSLQVLALRDNGATRVHKSTHPEMLDTYMDALATAAKMWETGASKTRELQIIADGELLSNLKARLRVIASDLNIHSGGARWYRSEPFCLDALIKIQRKRRKSARVLPG
ncbi:hypothetical protein B0H11DRAFT_2232246 [Mycena galericulata]|nr:hypothetical protein B0H11DRAFT_2232246 [Mycena galericulata]